MHRERALLLSAPAVLLLQLAHPLIAAAVAEHTDRGRTPAERAGATIGLNLAVIFGDREQAERAASHVRNLHARIAGQMPEAVGSFLTGSPYRADDPELLGWGHATIVWAGIQAYESFLSPLSASDRDRYVAEARSFGAAFGVAADSLPSTHNELRAYVSSVVKDVLRVGAGARLEAEEVLRPRGRWVEVAAGPAQRAVTAGLLPDAVRRGFDLPWGLPQRSTFTGVAAAARAAGRMLPRQLRWWPHYRAAVARLGRGER